MGAQHIVGVLQRKMESAVEPIGEKGESCPFLYSESVVIVSAGLRANTYCVKQASMKNHQRNSQAARTITKSNSVGGLKRFEL